ncbi:MAG TPA: iron uptake system protein EfeO [Hypericibacter adhaerens]|uniref:iron uptake system protein EfeO n=1 Tax=Hypericibacter adhaerens TaxID=2602016 RepID=UPI002C98E42A|nr:iron uptake system protein EfeO [Hypericibacter adhaerens]HWA44234.1 iron uptake system protein EfeO [Hypericibacter adhaerens]
MASNPPSAQPGRPAPALMKLAIAGAALLVIVAGAAFYFASEGAKRAQTGTAEGALTVTITDATCDPNEITVAAGPSTFTIVNNSSRTVEWEILDGVYVVEERENITPGLSRTMTTKLAPGDYDITCGLLSNPRGKLHVTPSAASAAEAAKPSMTAFIGPLAEYKVFLVMEAGALVTATQQFTDAVKAGDVELAKTLYGPAHTAYKHLEPVADRFADLDTAINARATYFEKQEEDPAFGGFHRLEYGLFARNSAEGLAPVADKLLADVTALQQRVRGLQVPPEKMADSAARLLTKVADSAATGDEDRYSHGDLADFQASLEGSRKIVTLLRPLTEKANPDLAKSLDAAFEATSAKLAGFKPQDQYLSYDRLSEADRKALADQFASLSTEITKLNAALGLE